MFYSSFVLSNQFAATSALPMYTDVQNLRASLQVRESCRSEGVTPVEPRRIRPLPCDSPFRRFSSCDIQEAACCVAALRCRAVAPRAAAAAAVTTRRNPARFLSLSCGKVWLDGSLREFRKSSSTADAESHRLSHEATLRFVSCPLAFISTNTEV